MSLLGPREERRELIHESARRKPIASLCSRACLSVDSAPGCVHSLVPELSPRDSSTTSYVLLLASVVLLINRDNNGNYLIIMSVK